MPATDAPVIRYLAEACATAEFRSIDIGCGGNGIAWIWRTFGPRLRVLAIDPNASEIERLRRAETHAGIEYLAASVVLPADHPFALAHPDRTYYTRNPWDRLSVVQTVTRLQSSGATLAPELGAATSGGSFVADTIVVPQYLRKHAINSIDFLKIDVDGADFDILNSFDAALDDLGVLGVSVEVNCFGDGTDADRSFQNVDRFMKQHGFELFDASFRRYSLAALPSRYLWASPAESEFGRPMFGNAIYLRDLSSPENRTRGAQASSAKLLNLVCLFAAFTLPDCAADVAVKFRDRLSSLCDVDRVLDLLAAQAQGPVAQPLAYNEYLARFAANDPAFYDAHKVEPPPVKQEHAADRLVVERLRSLGWTPRVIFDVGASNGFWSQTIVSVCPDAQFHLFEPLATQVAEYRSGLSDAIAQHPTFVLHELGLGDHTGDAVAYRFPNAYASTMLPLDEPEEDVQPIPVPVATLDELVHSRGLPIPNLLKIDVQGGELTVLHGAERVLPSIDVLLIETWLWRAYEGKTPLLLELATWLAARNFYLFDVAGGYRSAGDILQSLDCFFINAATMARYIEYRQYRAAIGAVDAGERAATHATKAASLTRMR